MDKSVTGIQTTFAKIDLKLIQRIERKLVNNMDEALAWARDPDGYMLAKLKGTARPKGLHFHIRVGKELFPTDTVIPNNQITFSTTLKLKPNIRKAVLTEVSKRIRRSAKPMYCDGCGYCRIAII
ncbi:hypothetical protein [Bradyrhizobium brasilense]|uniref:hypothetical protein n=1 Tax=Bradyrhizobium brasilense TaxID=1419277 RepID=UPI001E536D2D|nr:hypothetical protein [Bradyrhizobium brasilense]MCC8968902.1 hypothetical protein [Bradyrhizobium brasilense]